MRATKTGLGALGAALTALCLALPSAFAAPAPPGGERAEADRLMPSDSQVVMVINVRQMLNSPLVRKHGLAELKEALKKNPQAEQILRAAGVDPFKDIDNILVAGSGSPGSNKMVIAVRGDFDLEKVHKAAVAYAEKKPDQLKITKADGTRVYELRSDKNDNKPGYAAFANAHTLVVTPSKELTLETIKSAGKTPARPSEQMRAALAKVNKKESLWFAVVFTKEMKEALEKNPQMAEIAPKLESITGGLNLTTAAALQVFVHTADAKAAAQLRMLIDQVKPLLAVVAQSNEEAGPILNELLNSLKITTEKNTVDIRLKVTEDVIEKASKKDKDK